MKKNDTKPTSAPEVPPLGPSLLPEGEGSLFRVWAPNADSVSVVGTFNDWKEGANPMTREEGGVWAARVPEAREGHEYRFLLRKGEAELSRIDPRALKVTNSIGNGVLWRPAPLSETTRRFASPTLDRLVVYEMHIGTFRAEKGKGPGTFDSAISQLPYLKDLGVNCVEVMPVSEFAGDLSWGYNPAHPWAVESCYGGPEGLQRFVEAAHAAGIAVVLDVVYNHFGPSDLVLWQYDGWSENGLGGIYFYNDDRANTPWGQSRPDYGRGEVRTYIRDNALLWLKTYGVDGLRWDATAYVRTKDGVEGNDLPDGWTLCQWLNDELRREKPGFITIAEDLRDNSWVSLETAKGGAGFSSQWDGAFVHPVRGLLAAVRDEDRDLDSLVEALRHRHGEDAFRRVIYSESHDEVANGKARLPHEIDPAYSDSYAARKRSMLGALFTLTSPGIPMLFQGQEFLEDEWFRDEVPVDWDKLAKHGSVHAFYRDLIALRRNLREHTAGLCGQNLEVNHLDHQNKTLAFRRWREGGAGDDVIVVANLSSERLENYEIGVPTGGVWRVRLNSDAKAYSGDFEDEGVPAAEALPEPLDGYSHRIRVALAPYSALILSQDSGS